MKLKDLLSENVLGSLPSSKLMKMKWNPVTDKTLNEAPAVRGLEKLKDNYYGISDDIYDIQTNVKNVLGTVEGEEWAKNNNINMVKEIQLFKQLKSLFAKSKLGKVL
tara:strand:- start:54 stop:374 length:321 start_codon:yes stop_codon:yes gene_type:complete